MDIPSQIYTFHYIRAHLTQATYSANNRATQMPHRRYYTIERKLTRFATECQQLPFVRLTDHYLVLRDPQGQEVWIERASGNGCRAGRGGPGGGHQAWQDWTGWRLRYRERDEVYTEAWDEGRGFAEVEP
jgi:hypothetical protein